MRVLVRLLKALLPLAVIVAGVGGFVWLAETRPTLEPTVPVDRVIRLATNIVNGRFHAHYTG